MGVGRGCRLDLTGSPGSSRPKGSNGTVTQQHLSSSRSRPGQPDNLEGSSPRADWAVEAWAVLF